MVVLVIFCNFGRRGEEEKRRRAEEERYRNGLKVMSRRVYEIDVI